MSSATHQLTVNGRSLRTADSHGLERDAIGSWGVFAQGLAAAAPSVAVATVPFSLFVAAGKGAAWSAVIGLIAVMLIATTISFQAKRTVSSGSLGTYAGNGLGPGAAYAAGFSLLIGYITFATTGTLGGVLYFESFLDVIGIHSEANGFKLALVVLVVAVAVYLPYRGVSISAKYELVFEIIATALILIIIVASYISYGWRIDTEQWALTNLGNSTTFIAAVTAVGAYAGFESVASLGAESRDAHRTIARSLLRVVLIIGVLYILATYPQILQFRNIDGDSAILPQIATNAGVAWAIYPISLAVTIAFIVFVTAVINSAARGLFTLAHEGALPAVLTRVHPTYKTPVAGIFLIGIIATAFSVTATLSSVGRLVFDVYGNYVANWGFLVSYLLVVVATPIWLYRIKALTPARLSVSAAATVAIGYVIFSNFYPIPKFPFNILPLIFGAILLAGLLRYWYLRILRPEVAARIGSIQTLSESEKERLAELGILEVLHEEPAAEPVPEPVDTGVLVK
ncbi:APC family permease [Mycobacteroides abscessus]|uniref:APC family permease n=1 Tax=Mycobacteroides abscessus TaxID=36809 RepID=UPI000241BEEC|nr:APC family permease [Mycobacteroides abscessus]EHM15685.1 putative amino acid permease [Mycobacteroides abscessus subsp. massiliense CCUG 48898 = JCM 15300]EIV65326.1 putative amino acid permease [Mycobacteroides abscessus subsp. massiliense CCUG 48898 = JCM 15300]ORA90098.1 amino acid permease [Mycobacteroides abscessus subsp. massiliense]BAP98985.1 amino acid permease-associated region, putative [Mycobacteroides abscessus subsp. massiliense CCUG 48898 = JCM 15300]